MPVNYLLSSRGFCQIKKNQKIREKLGSGWVGQATTQNFFFGGGGNFVFFVCFFVLFSCFQMCKKKIG